MHRDADIKNSGWLTRCVCICHVARGACNCPLFNAVVVVVGGASLKAAWFLIASPPLDSTFKQRLTAAHAGLEKELPPLRWQ